MNAAADRLDELPPDDDVHAAEYVLGVLDAGARRAARERIANEPAFAECVQAWEARLAPWLARGDAVTPSDLVWLRIRARIRSGATPAPARSSVWSSVRTWRIATGMAAAAALVAFVAGRHEAGIAPPVSEEQAARPVTVLAREDGSTGWIASVDAARDKVLMVPVPTPADTTGRVHELWIIPAGKAPVSLGFVSNEKAHSIAVPVALRPELAVGATFAVTLEPQAGMPHAAPSGPVVAKGGISHI